MPAIKPRATRTAAAEIPQLAPPRPASAASVRPRARAVIDPDMVRTAEDAAVKHNIFPSRPGHPSGMTNLQTHLHVEAWVRNTTYAKHVWVDVHVFETGEAPVHTETLPLAYARPAGDGGDVFVLDAEVYQGLIATPGSVTPRPDARVVQYRLYAEVEGTVYTDGLLHLCELRTDTASG